MQGSPTKRYMMFAIQLAFVVFVPCLLLRPWQFQPPMGTWAYFPRLHHSKEGKPQTLISWHSSLLLLLLLLIHFSHV